MENCDACGNHYDKCFNINMGGKSHTFDCFECAISMLAPTCNHCKCKIIGHGVEEHGNFYCCVHCAKTQGVTSLKDRT
jgi:hypothetical protein